MSGPTAFGSDDEAKADAMSRELDIVAGKSDLMPTEGFADRVMAAVAAEPSPQPVAAFGAAVLGGRVRSAFGAVGDAWRVAFAGSRPVAIRAQALALVVVVAVGAIGLSTAAVAGAAGLFAPSRSAEPPLVPPSPSLVAPTPNSQAPMPSASPTPSASPESTGTPEPTETAGPTDDHGGNSGPGGGGASAATPRPAETPKATRTPEPSDDHGGNSGPGGGGGGDDSGDSGSGHG